MKKTLKSLFGIIIISVIFLNGAKSAFAGPFASMPVWCTIGTPSFVATHCAGNTITLTDGGGNWQSRWAGQYWVHTSATDHWLAYCLRDDLSHPISSSDGSISTLIDVNGDPVTLPAEYSYVVWKYGDTNDNNTASAIWMLGHYYAQDVTGSGNVIVPNLNASDDSTINALAQSMFTEASTQRGPWTVNVALSPPTGWDGSSDSGTVTVTSGSGSPVTGVTVNLSAVGGTTSVASVVTNGSGQGTFNYQSSGADITVTGTVSGPDDYVIIDPPGGADQLVGTSGGSTNFTDNDIASIAKYAVGDYVWYDDNKDGIQDSGEDPVNDATVTLFDDADNQVATTTTDVNGHYVFDNLDGGDYYIVFSDLPSGFAITTQDVSAGTDANDSNPDQSTGETPVFTLAVSNTNMRTPISGDGVTIATLIDPTIDMGIYQKEIDLTITKKLISTGTFKIGDVVTWDLEVKNNGPDVAVANWSITDLLPTGLSFSGTQPAEGSDSGFTCSTASAVDGGYKITCTHAETLSVGSTKHLRITTKIESSIDVSKPIRNLGFVAPAPGDTTETNPLVEPTFAVNSTDSTATNNDSQAVLSVATSATAPDTGLMSIIVNPLAQLMAVVGSGITLVGYKKLN